MLNVHRFVFQFLILVLFSAAVSAQTSSSSPYSRYGIGDLQFGGFTKNLGMGGISFGYRPSYNLNISNPASYSSLQLTTFETAVNMNQIQMKSMDKSQNTNNASLSYFAFGFPIKNKKWGAALGLLPYSNVGYTINDQQINADGDAELHTYDGSGGLNQFFIGNSYSPFKNFSIGANASYLFGVLNQERKIEYPYFTSYFDTRVNEKTSVGSLYFNFGIQWVFDSLQTAPSDSIKRLDKKLSTIHDSIEVIQKSLDKASPEQSTALHGSINSLNEEYMRTDSIRKHVLHRKDKSDWSLTFGLVGSPETSLSANYSRLTESYILNAFDQVIVKDTVENTDRKTGTLKLPFNAGFGIMLKQGNRWLIGADYSIQSWKNYSIFGVSDSLADSWRASLGAQFVPNDRAINSYWKNVQYRFGFYYEQTYLQLHGNQLNEYGASIGLGLPIKRSAAMMHISAVVGKRGTVSSNLIEENFIKLSLGFTLNDRWFVKQKFD